MSKAQNQLLDLFELSALTSINCWQSASLRYLLFINNSPFDQKVFAENINMIDEKVALSAEVLEQLSSTKPFDYLQFSTAVLESINVKAESNIKRLSVKFDA